MAMVFKNDDSATEAVELVGVGRLEPGGRGGVTVERAAEVMAELQEKNADGSLRLDENGDPIPLSGPKLTAAAKAFAQSRGIQVVNLAEDKIAELPAEVGMPPDRPPAAESAAEEYEFRFGTTKPWEPGAADRGIGLPVFNDDADLNVQGGAPPFTTTTSGQVPPLPPGSSQADVADEPGVKGGK